MYLLSFTMGRYLSLSVSLCKVPNDFVTENTRSGRDINQKCETLNYLVETIRLLQKDIHLETGFVWHFLWYVSVPLLFYLMCSFLVHSQHEGKIINGPANKNINCRWTNKAPELDPVSITPEQISSANSPPSGELWWHPMNHEWWLNTARHAGFIHDLVLRNACLNLKWETECVCVGGCTRGWVLAYRDCSLDCSFVHVYVKICAWVCMRKSGRDVWLYTLAGVKADLKQLLINSKNAFLDRRVEKNTLLKINVLSYQKFKSMSTEKDKNMAKLTFSTNL